MKSWLPLGPRGPLGPCDPTFSFGSWKANSSRRAHGAWEARQSWFSRGTPYSRGTNGSFLPSRPKRSWETLYAFVSFGSREAWFPNPWNARRSWQTRQPLLSFTPWESLLTWEPILTWFSDARHAGRSLNPWHPNRTLWPRLTWRTWLTHRTLRAREADHSWFSHSGKAYGARGTVHTGRPLQARQARHPKTLFSFRTLEAWRARESFGTSLPLDTGLPW